ncbi:SCP2 sterol-binding domain-containing protein [Iodobacter sp. CM08]|uniref:ubiquinone anaerobic biosynthesis accessory factor UbiT n=1 Tax=Iodobacter sp. CM08 TaxID=3085902 RepID=UPI00298286BE|nr:SCP2 sterol-binding domain-containing protein [Iodobacter sp. CM08]MDW5417363.1 SCP2 sterol-binding domain-containing protein [Iodobacter sp. CM08]
MKRLRQFILLKLPEAPLAIALASSLNLVKSKLWPEEDFIWLAGRNIRLEVLDIGRGLTLSFQNGGFKRGTGTADVSFSASLADYLVLARRLEDPDTLFFQRRLSIEGDTELGLTLKNLMDATDFEPLLAWLPSRLRAHLPV